MSPVDGYFIYLASRLDKLRKGGDTETGNWLQELQTWPLWRAVLAEFLATLVFVFIGTMSAVDIVPLTDPAGKFVRIGLTFGLMIAVCIQMIGHVSGGHMNPAVSLAMAVAMEISPARAVLYTVAQCCGGMLGSLLLKGVTPGELNDNLGLTTINPDLNGGQAVACEIVFTFILVMSIFGCTDPSRALFGSPALGIGLTVSVLHFASIPFTGASMNPARSLASSVVSNNFDLHWVYWVGPMVGGVAAAVAYKYLLSPYQKTPSFPETARQLMDSKDVIVLPKDYFGESGRTILESFKF
ncbi:aquaporin FA-CHIP-like [Mya arenaria]|uniref:aquaporin FA-CHIP-like n=1 Tax=Mya arenaria TaxID=6604 RepID=UPI0022E885A3|nr:aquaporin FA-CHIP-like [Mya arenaria]XP_052770366.1 aquaporin FA-CHIP-like [Mya arenaria]XP_052770368.1 aquaporin FA-CHIP-like [Mya arenaria]XP_052770369.1 aquaporin FA-CHIP-like [Mya arenaria]